MGVDIQTYRGRIGCFNRNFGTDVLTVQYIVNFTRGLKTIGAVVFIGILLLLAGIEQNPGPISENKSRRTPANATILKVCGLPKGIGTDSLISIFENTRRQGGGNVLRVDINENDSSALVEFEEAEALQLVLTKRPIHIDGKDVSVEIYYGEDSMNENDGSQMDYAGEVFEDKPNDLQLGSESEDVNKSGAVAKLASNFTRTVTERVRKGFGFIKSAANFGEQEFAVDETIGRHIVKTDIKRSDSSKPKESVESDEKIFWQMLAKLGLTDRYPGRISIKDIVALEASEWNKKEKGTISFFDVPWLVLKRLISSHSDARDVIVTKDLDLSNGIAFDNTLRFLSEQSDDKQDISPLDLIFIIFQCCDPFLKQVFVQKLYL